MARHIDGDHPVGLAECCDLRQPSFQPHADAVHQDERFARAVSI